MAAWRRNWPRDPLMTLEQTRAKRSPIGMAVVGMGNCGPNLLRVLGDNLDAEVRWICDLDRGRLEKYERRHPGARITTRLDRALADPGVDAVVIATPVHTHYRLAARALEAGKHVFVERPLAPSSELADELAEVAGARRRILMCGQTFLHSPPVQAIKLMIAERKLGEIYFISSNRVNAGATRPHVSVIADLGLYDFSILLYWLSEMPTSVRAVGPDPIRFGIGNFAVITLTFASGVVADVKLRRLAPTEVRQTAIVGTERTAVYDDGVPDAVRLFDCGADCREPDTLSDDRAGNCRGSVVSPQIESYEPLGLEMRDFISAIRDGEQIEFQTAIARSAVRVVEAAELSLSRGGREISVRPGVVDGQLLGRRALAAV
jgi:predicted dehydrogenase